MSVKRSFFIVSIFVFVALFAISALASDAKKDSGQKDQAATTEVKSDAKTEEKPAITSDEQTPKANTNLKTVNINRADAIELSSVLKKVGPKIAAAIVEYREANGEFKVPEDIKKVKGVGDKIFELNKDVIVVQD
ncbi:MAG: helix-hairpin-helix domain-containing protein [Desulfamplus sp.]|nr:helix-hairpin-helix domain-containing protein [Desulfamplus sp.]